MDKSVIIKLKKNSRCSICSCGFSKKLPYCDNSHREANSNNNTSYKSVKVYLLDDDEIKITCSNWPENEES
mgnify:FL=1|tara:strand:+ start:266 stop:478 length:213 start_codon:yes stop_codon:yes gene_type:complete